jgi:hypothetical protein
MKEELQTLTTDALPADSHACRPLAELMANHNCNATSAVQVSHHFVRKMVSPCVLDGRVPNLHTGGLGQQVLRTLSSLGSYHPSLPMRFEVHNGDLSEALQGYSTA